MLIMVLSTTTGVRWGNVHRLPVFLSFTFTEAFSGQMIKRLIISLTFTLLTPFRVTCIVIQEGTKVEGSYWE